MTDHDHPDTDLTDPHGEAEALRRENARLKVNLDRREKMLDSVILERTHYRKRAEAAEAALAAAPVAEAQPVAAIGGAELDALGIWKLANQRDADDPVFVSAITALRAQPDWQAMAERLGENAKVLLDWLDYDFSRGIRIEEFEARQSLRAALSDLAKMKGE